MGRLSKYLAWAELKLRQVDLQRCRGMAGCHVSLIAYSET